MRTTVSFVPTDGSFGSKLFDYLRAIPTAIVLETASNPTFNQKYSSQKINFLAGIGELSRCTTTSNEGLKSYVATINDWALGFFAYDYKNHLEILQSTHHDGIQWPDLLFVQPRFIIVNDEKGWHISYHKQCSSSHEALALIKEIEQIDLKTTISQPDVNLKAKVSKDEYLETVKSLQEHIHRGDVYEINYCIEFFNDNTEIDPYTLHQQLIKTSPVPFAAFAKINNRYLMSASPERYIKKVGNKIISQPIKGTASRHVNPLIDKQQQANLNNSIKERSENVMITDLVRNDLSKIAVKGSVKVDELCAIYPFQQVYQMISTISANLHPSYDWHDVISNTFPMGSMTGAPKIKAMQLIETYEKSKRGLYSGAIGYITPEANFDFNVVIRSLLYNKNNKYLSFMVGSAITSLSDAEQEYQECMTKASAIKQVLGIESMKP